MYFDEGYKEFKKGEFHNAVYFYTEGIKVKCKDDDLNAKLYMNWAAANKQTAMIGMRPLVLFPPHFMEYKMLISKLTHL